MLQTLPESLRRAFRDGDWDVYQGQAFPEFSRATHVIDPVAIPQYSSIYMTFDWGFGKPFSIGWWFVDSDGRIYRFAEWYGCTGQPDQGLRLPDTDIAGGIIERENALNIDSKKVIRYAGPDCFNKKPDYKGGGHGPSTAEVFSRYGVFLQPGDPNRKLKIRQFRERLRVLQDAAPMMLVFSTCKDFIRTIPAIPTDKNIEDVDTNSEDHIFDEACHICMARPIAAKLPEVVKSPSEKHLDDLDKKPRGLAGVFARHKHQTEAAIMRMTRGSLYGQTMQQTDLIETIRE